MKYLKPILFAFSTLLLAQGVVAHGVTMGGASTANAPVEPKVEEFPLSAVRLSEPSPFPKAMQIDRIDPEGQWGQ